MKRILLFAFTVLPAIHSIAQEKITADGIINFEGSLGSLGGPFEMWRDTITNSNCIWAIGNPQKQVLSQAHSPANVLITDTVNPYPVNDTSVFYVAQTAGFGWVYTSNYGLSFFFNNLQGWHYVDSDSLTDFGTVELSPDGGQSWIDLLHDTTFNVYLGVASYKPILTGRSGGWKPFRMHFNRISDSFNVHYGDTILMRFGFVSDSIQTNRGGLMFDDLSFTDYYVGIESVPSQFASTPSPNPATSTIHFTLPSQEDSWRINLYTLHGQKVKSSILEKGIEADIPVSDLPPGTYYYTITGMRTHQTSSGSVIIVR